MRPSRYRWTPGCAGSGYHPGGVVMVPPSTAAQQIIAGSDPARGVESSCEGGPCSRVVDHLVNVPNRLRIQRWNHRRIVKPVALHGYLDVPEIVRSFIRRNSNPSRQTHTKSMASPHPSRRDSLLPVRHVSNSPHRSTERVYAAWRVNPMLSDGDVANRRQQWLRLADSKIDRFTHIGPSEARRTDGRTRAQRRLPHTPPAQGCIRRPP
jgi:hypothetical protein